MRKVNLDFSKLLGFRAIRGSLAKVGLKAGGKIGNKTGTKFGVKAGFKR